MNAPLNKPLRGFGGGYGSASLRDATATYSATTWPRWLRILRMLTRLRHYGLSMASDVLRPSCGTCYGLAWLRFCGACGAQKKGACTFLGYRPAGKGSDTLQVFLACGLAICGAGVLVVVAIRPPHPPPTLPPSLRWASPAPLALPAIRQRLDRGF